MPRITITLEDTPTGGVSIKTDFSPAIGQPCSAAQAATLDIISRTKREWQLTPTGTKAPLLHEVDAVHRTRDRVVGPAQ